MTISVGSEVFIRTGYATAHCVVGVSGVYGLIVDETPKAWHVKAYNPISSKSYTCYIPKKALVKVEETTVNGKHVGYRAQLAKWFEPTGWTSKFFDLCLTSSVISA